MLPLQEMKKDASSKEQPLEEVDIAVEMLVETGLKSNNKHQFITVSTVTQSDDIAIK